MTLGNALGRWFGRAASGEAPPVPAASADAEAPPRPQVTQPPGTLLCGARGPIKLTDSQRQLCAVVAGERGGVRILIANGKRLAAPVQSVLRLVREHGYEVEAQEERPMEEVQRLYGRQRASVLGSEQQQYAPRKEELAALIREGAMAGASDIHLKIEGTVGLIRMRVHGSLTPWRQDTAENVQALMATAYNLARHGVGQWHPRVASHTQITPRDHEELAGLEKIDGIRCTFVPQALGPGAVLRFQYTWPEGIRTMADLGFSRAHEELLALMRARPEGLILLSGPTGSGKSTTTTLMLRLIREERDDDVHIVTLEDPPEYEQPGVSQLVMDTEQDSAHRREVFLDGIRYVLRYDPDVVFIGEVRDPEGAELAMQAAATGHLVFGTVHVTSPFLVPDRLAGQLGVHPDNLNAEMIAGLVGQRLVALLCPECSEPLTERLGETEVLTALAQRLDAISPEILAQARARGRAERVEACRRCGGAGRIGRTALAEVVLPDEGFFAAWREGGAALARDYWRENLGGVAMVDQALRLIAEGRVDPRDVERHVRGLGEEVMVGRARTLGHMERLPVGENT